MYYTRSEPLAEAALSPTVSNVRPQLLRVGRVGEPSPSGRRLWLIDQERTNKRAVKKSDNFDLEFRSGAASPSSPLISYCKISKIMTASQVAWNLRTTG